MLWRILRKIKKKLHEIHEKRKGKDRIGEREWQTMNGLDSNEFITPEVERMKAKILPWFGYPTVWVWNTDKKKSGLALLYMSLGIARERLFEYTGGNSGKLR